MTLISHFNLIPVATEGYRSSEDLGPDLICVWARELQKEAGEGGVKDIWGLVVS